LEPITLSDEELVAIIQTRTTKGKKLRAGNTVTKEQAWGHLITKYSPKLEKRAAIKWFGGNTYAAEAASEIWGKIFEKIDLMKCGAQPGLKRARAAENQGSFQSWLFKTFDRHCIDILRKNNPGKFKMLPLDNVDEQEGTFDRIHHMVDGIYTAESAEREFMSQNDQSVGKYRQLIRLYLSKSKTAFFLDYQDGLKKKISKNKTKFFRIKNELVLNVYNAWTEHDRPLEQIMTKTEAYALHARFVLGIREADICRELGIGKSHLHILLENSIRSLIEALGNESAD